MRIAAHSTKFAKDAGISQAVAREYYQADQRTKRRAAITRAIKRNR
jgi:hypothetical protein